ncbi:unnamed protein product, partial [Ectocarpus sp. 12 AP-2014]
LAIRFKRAPGEEEEENGEEVSARASNLAKANRGAPVGNTLWPSTSGSPIEGYIACTIRGTAVVAEWTPPSVSLRPPQTAREKQQCSSTPKTHNPTGIYLGASRSFNKSTRLVLYSGANAKAVIHVAASNRLNVSWRKEYLNKW